jgi:hypothetical protein
VASGRKIMLDLIQVSTENSLLHGFENFMLLRPPKIIYKFTQPPQIYWSTTSAFLNIVTGPYQDVR